MQKYIPALLVALTLTTACPAADPVAIGQPFSVLKSLAPGDQVEGIRFLGALKLKRTPLRGLEPRQLSGLAWDRDERRLYAVSDDGYVVHLEPEFDGDVLTGVNMVDAFPLQDANGDALADDHADAEGLELSNADNGIAGDTELLVSFEQQPRIAAYTRDGRHLRDLELPAALRDGTNYRDANKELESLAFHPQAGLLTAPEEPLTTESADRLSIYALNGQRWQFAPVGEASALVGMEAAGDGDVYVLERHFRSLFKPITFALRRVHLNRAQPNSDAPVTDVIRFVSSDGWAIDNFEAVARHEGARFFMISDDNRNGFQKTLLLYFEVTDELREVAATP